MLRIKQLRFSFTTSGNSFLVSDCILTADEAKMVRSEPSSATLEHEM